LIISTALVTTIGEDASGMVWGTLWRWSMDEVLGVLVRVALVGAMAAGGSLFAFSAFVMAALKRVPEAEGVRAMQSINVTVFTPWFMVPFFGTAVLSVGAVVVALLNTDQGWWLPLLMGGALYGVGLFLVTVVGNVPLNERLARMDANEDETAVFWRTYLNVWTRWNHVRSAAAVGSVLLYAETLRLMGS
jgi:uncharacterized membrane protein